MVVHLKSSGSISSDLEIGNELDVYIDGHALGLHWISLNSGTDDYVECQFFVANGYPSWRTTRVYFAADWYGGDESSDLTFKVDLWHKGEGDDMSSADLVDQDVLIKGALENERISDCYYDIAPGTINGGDLVRVRLHRNYVIGDGRKLRIWAVRVETL